MSFLKALERALWGIKLEAEKSHREMKSEMFAVLADRYQEIAKRQQEMAAQAAIPPDILKGIGKDFTPGGLYTAPDPISDDDRRIAHVMQTEEKEQCNLCGGDIFRSQDAETDCTKFPNAHLTARQIVDYVKRRMVGWGKGDTQLPQAARDMAAKQQAYQNALTAAITPTSRSQAIARAIESSKWQQMEQIKNSLEKAYDPSKWQDPHRRDYP